MQSKPSFYPKHAHTVLCKLESQILRLPCNFTIFSIIGEKKHPELSNIIGVYFQINPNLKGERLLF